MQQTTLVLGVGVAGSGASTMIPTLSHFVSARASGVNRCTACCKRAKWRDDEDSAEALAAMVRLGGEDEQEQLRETIRLARRFTVDRTACRSIDARSQAG